MKTLAPESLSAVSQTALWGWLSSYNIRKLGHSILETTRNKAPCDGALQDAGATKMAWMI